MVKPEIRNNTTVPTLNAAIAEKTVCLRIVFVVPHVSFTEQSTQTGKNKSQSVSHTDNFEQ